jgi:hypothetical protein
LADDRIIRLLQVPLNEETVAVRAQELAQAELYRCQVTDELEAATAEWKEQKKLHESKVMTASAACERLGRVVKEKQEEQNVECHVTIRDGQYTMVRTDTGEVVITRPATPGELQLAFPNDVIGG